MPSVIMSCKNDKCRNSTGRGALFQNKEYGKGKRVMSTLGKDAEDKYCCSVCGLKQT